MGFEVDAGERGSVVTAVHGVEGGHKRRLVRKRTGKCENQKKRDVMRGGGDKRMERKGKGRGEDSVDGCSKEGTIEQEGEKNPKEPEHRAEQERPRERSPIHQSEREGHSWNRSWLQDSGHGGQFRWSSGALHARAAAYQHRGPFQFHSLDLVPRVAPPEVTALG